MSEKSEIYRYIASKSVGGLYPVAAESRIPIDGWITWTASDLEPLLKSVAHPLIMGANHECTTEVSTARMPRTLRKFHCAFLTLLKPMLGRADTCLKGTTHSALCIEIAMLWFKGEVPMYSRMGIVIREGL